MVIEHLISLKAVLVTIVLLVMVAVNIKLWETSELSGLLQDEDDLL